MPTFQGLERDVFLGGVILTHHAFLSNLCSYRNLLFFSFLLKKVGYFLHFFLTSISVRAVNASSCSLLCPQAQGGACHVTGALQISYYWQDEHREKRGGQIAEVGRVGRGRACLEWILGTLHPPASRGIL